MTCADESLVQGTEVRRESSVNGETRSEMPSSSQQGQKINHLLTEMERVVKNDETLTSQLW